ncbi:MAG: hypothetical protein OEQ13_11605, partial [Acidobacteriota bacterium]|nr:hypothetical protein [Acidobacteriota bacterium]
MSYITFRMIHYVVEVYRGKAHASSFADFASYVLFFPTYISGPVERFPAFHKQTAAEKDFDLADVNQGLYRIVSGIVKKVAGDTLAPYVVPILAAPTEASPWVLLLAVYGLAIKVYLDFSGYTDIALGISRLFGYKIMENFNWPYLRKNIALFWRNWHISVYSFIRDYFFFPFFGRHPSTLKTSIGIFCTMLVFMLWHEASWRFVMLGVYHGAGLVAWQLTQELKRTSPALRRVLGAKAMVPVSTLLTFSFVSFSMLVFDYDLPHIGVLLRHLLSF